MSKIIKINNRSANALVWFVLLSTLSILPGCSETESDKPTDIENPIEDDNSTDDGNSTDGETDEGETDGGEGETNEDDDKTDDDSGDEEGQIEIELPYTIEAEDYVAFTDSDSINEGGALNTDGVDIEATNDSGGGYNIGWTQVGETLSYSISLPKGDYELQSRVASEVGGGAFSVTINNQLIGTDQVSPTGGWQTFEDHIVGGFQIAEGGEFSLVLTVTGANFNLNWLKVDSIIDTDADGIKDSGDLCPTTPANMSVNKDGCPDSDADGIFDNYDQCADTEADTQVDYHGCELVSPLLEVAEASLLLVGGQDSSKPNYTLYVFDADIGQSTSQCNDQCAVNWPPLLAEDNAANGVAGLGLITRNDATQQVTFEGKPLYFYIGDQAESDKKGDDVPGWHSVSVGQVGDLTALYNVGTVQEPAIHYVFEDKVITKLADRGRDRHAKEDQFQQYDHYLSHYWTHRTARFKFTDNVASGGNKILVEWVSEWKLQALEFRAWYSGMNTVAQYHGNYEPDVVEHGKGTYDNEMEKISDEGDQYKYSLEINEYRNLHGSRESLAVGQYMEIEVSQFLDGVPEGRTNYYGTTYLYQVGTGGMVPWKTVGDFDDKSSERENSHPIDQAAWLGGKTTLPYQYTNEPNDHYMQMATNLSSVNGQPFVLGRRVHHTSFVDGSHDEDPANGTFNALKDLSNTRMVNHSCASCHERNGRAAPAEIGESLTKWVFKVATADGETHPTLGNVLQPDTLADFDSEGQVVIANWLEEDGLRQPQYQFTGVRPDKFSARIAPPLIGLGLLEAIGEQAIIALEDVDDKVAPFGISGRAQKVIDPVTGDTRLGRFGWKAATSSVKHQVAAALNTDIGVKTTVLPVLDCGSEQNAKHQCDKGSATLDDEHLDNLVKYISLLGVRAQRDIDQTNVINGKALFSQIGCADCHTPTFTTVEYHPLVELAGQTIHPYSDMLLHDMGPGLADNLGEGLASGAEWRTTPLWGIGLSACVTGGVVNLIGGQGNEVCTPVHSYLHDGRARTLEEAILWHGGESEASKEQYEQLSEDEKSAVLAFLKSL
ncbi:carbohydrate-binding protein [Psychrosphaera sp. B3R10]|uniref:di-heme oxidoredictase family protein n=1 Tax=unclassified Psychrosphaera TaxID=2641570 RepID=UPI001C09C5FB|nr:MULTISPECIES: di-heme oxidoredictase family protein [unclassified Psychrosphaera]MBU2882018.1 carbohydrate-binding protein [Psychrosphaera sp. I2R16]MBU2989851.1 carbohydrate-binding protein [Psychrosphaera sp. B3R10]